MRNNKKAKQNKNQNTNNNFIKKLEPLFARHTRHQVMSDWLRLTANSIHAASAVVEAGDKGIHDAENAEILRHYTQEEAKAFPEALAALVEIVDADVSAGKFRDWLGEAYMHIGISSKDKGQFFTPYSVGYMTALCSLQSKTAVENTIREKGFITINDPCVGGGCLPIAACDILHSWGVNYQQKAVIVCNDADERCCDMAYIQLSLIGAIATVDCMNTLTMEKFGSRDTLFMVYFKKSQNAWRALWDTRCSSGNTAI